jgi:hypothetical protein
MKNIIKKHGRKILKNHKNHSFHYCCFYSYNDNQENVWHNKKQFYSFKNKLHDYYNTRSYNSNGYFNDRCIGEINY